MELPTSRDAVNAAFRRLREFKRSFGPKPNMHDLADAMIAACIVEGFTVRKRIVGALRTIGLNHAHVVLTLQNRTGNDPAVHLWILDEGEHYRLLEPSESAGSRKGGSLPDIELAE